MKTVNLAEAKAQLSKLVAEIRSGAEPEIVIALAGKPAAKLVPLGNPPRRLLGIDAGLFALPEDFEASNAEIARLFRGSRD